MADHHVNKLEHEPDCIALSNELVHGVGYNLLTWHRDGRQRVILSACRIPTGDRLDLRPSWDPLAMYAVVRSSRRCGLADCRLVCLLLVLLPRRCDAGDYGNNFRSYWALSGLCDRATAVWFAGVFDESDSEAVADLRSRVCSRQPNATSHLVCHAW